MAGVLAGKIIMQPENDIDNEKDIHERILDESSTVSSFILIPDILEQHNFVLSNMANTERGNATTRLIGSQMTFEKNGRNTLIFVSSPAYH